jgi:hypoxanthine phosphoribosyltransferase
METWLALLIAMVSVVLGGLLTWVIGKAQLVYLLQRLTDMVMDRERVSVNEEFVMTQILSEKIKDSAYVPDLIFAICPGGGMIAEWLSRRFLGDFDAPIPVGSLCIVTERTSGGVIASKARIDEKSTMSPTYLHKDAKVLLVNDISRGGYTLEAAYKFLREFFPDQNIKSATLFCHSDASVKPTYYVAITGKTIRFDWKSHN